MSSLETNKKIAKNTLYLYLRMLFIMAISLYTVRIILNALGEEDYGIYNVVGGIVTLFSFLTSTMSSASQRFFSYELGKGDYVKLNKYFNINLLCYFLISVVIIILAETIGLWLLNAQMTIPENRVDAAHWVYHFAVISFMISLWTIPYSAMIVAHEKMSIYAYVGIFEALFRLIIAYILTSISFDRLKVYAVLTCILASFLFLSYYVYCDKKYREETKIHNIWDYSIFKEVVSYSGWNLFGAFAIVMRNQGVNILLNIYFNPIVNAARAIALQVESAVVVFANNFFTAVKPQIIKQYSANERAKMMGLIFRSTRFCFFLVFVIALPVILETDTILKLWLNDYPAYTIDFTRISILYGLVDVLCNPMVISVQATGKVKTYQIVISSVLILIIPLSYLFLRMGCRPNITLYITLIISIICFFIRISFMKSLLNMPIIYYIKDALLPIIIVTVISTIPPFIVHILLDESFIRLILVMLVSIISSAIAIYSLGITNVERKYINNLISSKMSR